MKQLSKILLAAVASVALAAPSFAWDFSASGTATASFNQTSVKADSGADTKESTIGSGVSSAGSSLTLASSHTDGANTASFTYVLDWDGNLDETLTVSGSKKVGEWTASGAVAYSPQTLGCSATDNGSAGPTGTAHSASAACAGTATGEDSTSVTLTNGTMTIVLGDASHLSGQNVTAGTPAAGLDGMDSKAGGADCSVGACVDSFHGASLGYAVSDTMSVTVAYQNSSDVGDLMGTGEFLDGETTVAPTGGTLTHTTSGFGIGFSGTFGPATVGFTQMSASTADATGSTDEGKKSTSWSTMGLGVKIDLGDIDPFLSYGTAEGTAGSAANSKVKHAHSGSEVGLTYALGSDTVTVVMGSLSDEYSGATGDADKPTEWSIMEVGYATAVGPASLSIGYGTTSKADGDGTASGDGYSRTDLDVELSISF